MRFGPSRRNVRHGIIVFDFRVDVGRVFFAEGRAGWGQVKNVAFPKLSSKVEDTIKDKRVWKIVFLKLCTYWPNLLHQYHN